MAELGRSKVGSRKSWPNSLWDANRANSNLLRLISFAATFRKENFY